MDALLELNSYDWLVFTSANGVTAFFDLFFKRFHDLRDIGGARIAAVGPATAAKLRELHLQVDLMPEDATAQKLAEAFAKYETIENLKMCLLRAEVANRELPEALEELGAIVDDIAIYKTVAETEDLAGAGERLLANGADWVTFTSGSTVEHFHARFDLPKLREKIPANENRLHRPGNQQGHPRVEIGTGAGGEGTHHGRLDGGAAACRQSFKAARKRIIRSGCRSSLPRFFPAAAQL